MPILYVEKGAGLHKAITAAGHSLMQVGMDWVASDDAAVQAIIDSYDPLPSLRDALRESVAAERISRQQRGLLYSFPNGDQGTIQTRDAQDLLNINGMATNALIAKSAGVRDAVLPFRDEENRTHMLTPDQMIGMAVASARYVSTLYQAKWLHDSAIAAWDGSSEYDLTAYWPEA